MRTPPVKQQAPEVSLLQRLFDGKWVLPVLAVLIGGLMVWAIWRG
jgi:hypothetical protein